MLAFLCLLAIAHTRTNIWRVLYGGVVDANLLDLWHQYADVPLAVAELLVHAARGIAGTQTIGIKNRPPALRANAN